ncbi:MAG: 23S rRNA (cytidine1920-2'-O)/16S rRNA (cytidine1409-2'-O)-methyltransferase [Pontimonas sp.]
MSNAQRLDSALVARGMTPSRTKAQRRIAQGDVAINGAPALKASQQVSLLDEVTLSGRDDYVGRGAYKLRAALAEWNISTKGVRCVDIGASTGGFTQVLLEAGAEQVFAVDVGHDQLHPALRGDSRVVTLEGINIRDVSPSWWEGLGAPPIDLIVVDVSFISLTHVLPPAAGVWAGASWVVLVKPQFEVGRTHISGGLALNPDDHATALTEILECATALGLGCEGMMNSPITGEFGNREYLCFLTPTASKNPPQWGERIHHLTHPELGGF